MSYRKKIGAIMTALGALLLAACTPTPTGMPTAIWPTDTPTVVAMPTLVVSSPTAEATDTPVSAAFISPLAQVTSTATPSATPVPTATAMPAPTLAAAFTPATPQAGGPVIAYFRSDAAEADPGGSVTLEWQSSGGNRATLYRLLPTGQLGTSWDVAPTGSMLYGIPSASRNWEGFALFVTDNAGRVAQAMLRVALSCPDTWFFLPALDECPSGPPLLTDGAEEHFERGQMLWSKAENRIYVLFADGLQPAWMVFMDEWDEGVPESDPQLEPPEGLYQPMRGFGLAWRRDSAVQRRLGWAVDRELGYAAAIQRTARSKYDVTYIREPDYGVLELGPEGSSWRRLSSQ